VPADCHGSASISLPKPGRIFDLDQYLDRMLDPAVQTEVNRNANAKRSTFQAYLNWDRLSVLRRSGLGRTSPPPRPFGGWVAVQKQPGRNR
jgi:hypothetical protein